MIPEQGAGGKGRRCVECRLVVVSVPVAHEADVLDSMYRMNSSGTI
jgi:hypothetical protein